MRDERIVELYWQRQEAAIRETEQKYGHYLAKIAYNILSDWEDCRESVNDTYLGAWNTIPPQKPVVLSSYLAKLTRRISIDIFRKRNREKRRASAYALSLAELEESLSGGNTTWQNVDLHLLAEAVCDYLRTLPRESRALFVCRYYFADSLREAAASCHMSESRAKSRLYRIRMGLKDYLEKEGFAL